jgi:hypothetical protein
MSLNDILTPITDAEADVLGANGDIQKYPLAQIATLNQGAQIRVLSTAPTGGYFYVIELDTDNKGTAVLFPRTGAPLVAVSAGEAVLAPSNGWLTLPTRGEVRVFVAARPVLADEWNELNDGRDGDGNKQTGHEFTVTPPTQPTTPTAPPPSPPPQAPTQTQDKSNTPRAGN